MNTTRSRKTTPASSEPASTKPARSRAKVSSPETAAVVAKPRRAAAPDAAKVAVKVPRSTIRKAALKTAVEPAAGAGRSAGAATPVAAADASKTAHKRGKAAPVAPPVVVAASAVKPPRKGGKAKSAGPTVDVQVRDAVIARLDAMKANDLKVIDVRGKTSITDCLVIASGTSTRHVRSMGDEVIVTAKKFGLPPIGVEGEKDAEWMLVDLGDTVVHVMLPRARDFYGLERLWTLAEEARSASARAQATV